MAMHVQPLFDASNWNFEGILIVWQPNSNIEESVGMLTQNLFKGFIISTVIALIISYILAKFQVNRINRMRKATKQIADGNFDVHLDVKNNDELDDLAEDFNQMAVALKDSHIEIDRQEERRRNFMADVAHEMRTPLTTINGLLEGLAFNAIPENQKDRCISLMQNETRRLIRLVNENLDYEKILTNQITIAIQKLNGTEILENVIEQLDKKAQEKNDQLILETIEPVDVYADYDRFVQVMVNVITNAIQFTEDGEIRIGITRGYMETIVTISDTGIGMSEEQVKNIWDRYYKADPSRKNTKYGESGLGLSIVDQLVKLHGGTIKVESKLDEGTTFTITFPDQQPN
jgi:signal transduction histidine kinase